MSRQALAAPATVNGERLPFLCHWETGKAGSSAMTREPGDLPLRASPIPLAGVCHGSGGPFAVTRGNALLAGPGV